MSRWPVPVALAPDELFSMWIVRAALAQGADSDMPPMCEGCTVCTLRTEYKIGKITLFGPVCNS